MHSGDGNARNHNLAMSRIVAFELPLSASLYRRALQVHMRLNRQQRTSTVGCQSEVAIAMAIDHDIAYAGLTVDVLKAKVALRQASRALGSQIQLSCQPLSGGLHLMNLGQR